MFLGALFITSLSANNLNRIYTCTFSLMGILFPAIWSLLCKQNSHTHMCTCTWAHTHRHTHMHAHTTANVMIITMTLLISVHATRLVKWVTNSASFNTCKFNISFTAWFKPRDEVYTIYLAKLNTSAYNSTYLQHFFISSWIWP